MSFGTLWRRIVSIRLTQHLVTVCSLILIAAMPALIAVDELVSEDDIPQAILAFSVSFTGFILLILYLRYRWRWIPVVVVMGLAAVMGLGIPEPFVTEYVAYVLILPPIFAMLITSPRWVVLSACCTGVIILYRAGWQGAYVAPTSIAITSVALGSLLLNNLIRNQALRDVQKANAELERRVEERTRALTTANEELGASREAMAEALRGVAHDLNNFLTGHQGNTELARVALDLGELDELYNTLDALRHGVATMAGFVADLQASSNALSGKLTLAPEPTDLVALSHRVNHELTYHFRRAKITCTVEADPTISCAWCDPTRMLRVIFNLVGNAVKFTAGHGSRVTIRVWADDAQVYWACTDDGCGIAPEKIDLLGQEFLRVVEGDAIPSGHGIGLHFCQLVMHMSGGTITYTSPGLGQGTTVVLALPIAHHLTQSTDCAEPSSLKELVHTA